ncbi:hypothetical protein B0H19DRAFT_1253575 [Mycena capillaripes]|nr:hypothetical protein B0H19DRAFT_1253575 [Mycena capillaripes]
MSQLVARNRDLLSLYLDHPSDRWSAIWTVLRTEQIHLTDLRLTLLDSRDPKEDVDSNRMADIFFDSVLPRLSHSLVQLLCATHYECRWSFETHNASTISLLQHLSKLEMCANSTDVPDDSSSTSYSGNNAVERLPQLGTELPALRHLGIWPTNAEANREFQGVDDTWEGQDPSGFHREAVSDRIEASLPVLRRLLSRLMSTMSTVWNSLLVGWMYRSCTGA